jgi:hypothetical protein
MKLIGISGLKTSGKDSTYKAIAEALPDLNVRRVAFADKLKELAALALGIDRDFIKRMDEAKEYWTLKIEHRDMSLFDVTGREYLQHIGVGARKVFGDSFWVNQILPPAPKQASAEFAREFIAEFYQGVDVLCVTDVRYPNEADRVHELGGQIWNIVRPGIESDGHSSEIPLSMSKIDLFIQNNGSLEDLYTKVARCIPHIEVACAPH